MLKLMIIEFVYSNKYLDVHQALGRNFRKLINLKENDRNLYKIYGELKASLSKTREPMEVENEIIPSIRDYIYKKR